MNKYKWIYEQVQKTKLDSLSQALNLSSCFCEILVKREINDYEKAELFFCPHLNQLHSPHLMKDMGKAVDRIKLAVQSKQRILIYGDYDVDGTTSSALLFLFLTEVLSCDTNNINFYIPDRIKEGYGLHDLGMSYVLNDNPDLLITVDCGITSTQQIKNITNANIDCIICDHHIPPKEHPPALAILNPKQQNCAYPYKELSACAVVFKLIQALGETTQVAQEIIFSYLDLVALSIAADIVPLTGENRVLAYLGLQELNKRKRPSINLLSKLSLIDLFSVENIVFGIAPKINAAGRITHAKNAVNLLVAQDESLIKQLSSHLQQQNIERRKIQDEVYTSALLQYQKQSQDQLFSIVLSDATWFKGVVGIVASKFVEQYFKPTVIFTEEDDYLIGSGRSYGKINLFEVLKKCSRHIEQFGGHAFAAGLKIKKNKFIHFKQAFEEAIAEESKYQLPVPQLEIDAKINLSKINDKTMQILQRMQPFGPHNQNPLWLAEKVTLVEAPKVIKEKHLRLIWQQEQSILSSIFFFSTQHYLTYLEVGSIYDIVFKLKQERWNGKIKTSAIIKDINRNI